MNKYRKSNISIQWNIQFSSVQFSRSVMSDSLRPHELHARPPCPPPTPGVHSNSCPLSQWCHPSISSSVVPFSSCPQSLPALESFPMSQLFVWGGQSTGVSALASFLPKKSQGWSPSEWSLDLRLEWVKSMCERFDVWIWKLERPIQVSEQSKKGQTSQILKCWIRMPLRLKKKRVKKVIQKHRRVKLYIFVTTVPLGCFFCFHLGPDKWELCGEHVFILPVQIFPYLNWNHRHNYIYWE